MTKEEDRDRANRSATSPILSLQSMWERATSLYSEHDRAALAKRKAAGRETRTTRFHQSAQRPLSTEAMHLGRAIMFQVPSSAAEALLIAGHISAALEDPEANLPEDAEAARVALESLLVYLSEQPGANPPLCGWLAEVLHLSRLNVAGRTGAEAPSDSPEWDSALAAYEWAADDRGEQSEERRTAEAGEAAPFAAATALARLVATPAPDGPAMARKLRVLMDEGWLADRAEARAILLETTSFLAGRNGADGKGVAHA